MKKSKNLHRAILWVTFFILYAATTARDILPADSGEFQLVAATLGIAHPPGYPLYTMIGALWVRLFPLGSIPFRLNLLSAALAATTLLLTSEAVQLWARSWRLPARAARIGGLLSALLLGSAATFWAQSTIANIRMPTLLFTAWGFLALAHYRHAKKAPQQQSALIELALALGLGVGHHPSLAFVALGWALYLLLLDPRLYLQPRRWWKAALVTLLAWTIPQLYLPLRGSMAGVMLDPGNLGSWQGFWNHVLARGFGGDMFAFANVADLTQRLPLLPTLFRMQFAPLFLAGISLGWIWLCVKHWKLGVAFLATWGVHTFITITYRAPQTVEYLAPVYIPMAITFGLSCAALITYARQSARSKPLLKYGGYAVGALIGAALLLPYPRHIPDFTILALDTSTRERMAPLLDTAPTQAKILADWRWATPLWVLQQVENRNPDAEVSYVYPLKDMDYAEVWQMLAADTPSEQPLFSTHAYAWEDWVFAPLGGGYRLYRRPLEALPEGLGFTPHVTDLGSVRLLGYQIQGQAQPGKQIDLRLAWQATQEHTDAPSFTGRIWDANAGLLAQADRNLGHDSAPGEVRFTKLTLQLPWDRCTAVAYPDIGVYTVQNGEFTDLGSTSLPEIAMDCTFPTLPTQNFHPGIVWGGPWLRGVDYNVDGSENRSAFLHWCGPGKGLIVHSGGQSAFVHPLGVGQCQSVSLPLSAGENLTLQLTRPDGAAAQLISTPFTAPKEGSRYLPYGDKIVLVGSRTRQRDAQFVVDLQWRTSSPIVDDYAISVRFWDEGTQSQSMHDSQPALGALPTLKWVTRDMRLLDPHPFDTEIPENISVVVYERFLLTALHTSAGDVNNLKLTQE